MYESVQEENAGDWDIENGTVTIAVAEQEELKDHYTTYEFVVEDNGIGREEPVVGGDSYYCGVSKYL